MRKRNRIAIAERLQTWTALVSAAALAFQPALAFALPEGGQVSAGQASIAAGAGQLTVNQSSQRAVIDWSSFNVGSGESVRFNQPTSSSITLNRIHDANPSSIDGQITANGQVWLINPNGVMFGNGAQVNVGGLLATTADIDNGRFMSGDYTFNHPGNPLASIFNLGRITIADGGLAALVGPNVTNSGMIQARLGKVQLGSGDTFTLDLYGDGLINLQASPAITQQLVENSGTISADGGSVLLTAAAAENVVNSLINMDGLIEADSVGNKQGTITLYGEGGNAVANNITADKGQRQGDSTVLVSGQVSAIGANSGEHGGLVEVLGDHVGILSGAAIDASGASGGGTIKIGGDTHGGGITPAAGETIVQSDASIKANALDSGDGGHVTVWADDWSSFAGSIEAKGGPNGGDGGFVETSGKQTLSMSGDVNASAPNGNAGTWLMDPNNVILNTSDSNESGDPNFVMSGSGSINVSHINTDLSNGTNVNVTAGGSIEVSNNISKTNGADASLTLAAGTDIVLDSNVTISSSHNKLNVTFDADTALGGGAIVMNGGSGITSNGGNITLGGGEANPANIVAGTGYAVGDSTYNQGIYINGSNPISITTGTGNIIMNGQGYNSALGSSNYGVYLGGTSGTSLTTTSGNISFNGFGGNGTTNNYGVYVTGQNGGAISTTSGAITIAGTAGAAGTTSSYTGNEGVRIGTTSASITSSGTGTVGAINITGIGAGYSGGGGVEIDGPTTGGIVGADANISITGTGASGTGGTNHGVYFYGGGANVGAKITGAGNLTVMGTGGGGGSDGVYNANENQSTVSGNITVTGTGGSGGGNGVHMYGSGTGYSTTSGAINITGTGSSTGGYGVYLYGADVSSSGTGAVGAVNITGTGEAGAGAFNAGVYTYNNSAISGVDANITVTGTSGSAGSNSRGMDIESSVATTGTGSLTLIGTGGSGSGSVDSGVFIAAPVSTVNGTLTVTGTGGSGGGDGVFVYGPTGGAITTTGGTMNITGTGSASWSGTALYQGANIASTGTGAGLGTVTVSGTGGAGTGTDAYGIIFYGGAPGTISTADANLILNGTGGNTSGVRDYGIYFSNGSKITGTGSGNITVNSTGMNGAVDFYADNTAGNAFGGASDTGNITLNQNSATWGTTLTVQTAGTVTIAPNAASTTIGVADGAGTLDITSGILNNLTAGSITIGNSADTGAMAINAYAWNAPASFISGNAGNITVNGDQTGTGGLTFTGPTSLLANINTSGNVSFDHALTLTGDRTIDSGNGDVSFAGTVDGAHAFTVDAGTGAVSFGGAVGGATPLTDLSISGGALSWTTLAGTGALTIQPGTGTSIGIAGGAGAMNLNATALSHLTGWASETFGNPSGTGNINVNAFSWGNSVSLQTGSGTLTVAGAQTMNGHDLNLITDSGNLALNAAVSGVHNLTLQTNTGTLTFPGTLSGTGNLIIQPGAATSIGLAGGAGTFSLSASALNNLTGWASETFGNPSGTADMNVGAYSWANSVTLQNGSGNLNVNGAQTMNGHDLTLVTDSGNLALNAGTPGVNNLTLQTNTGSLTFPGTLSGTGNLIIQPGAATAIGLAGGAGALSLSAATLNNFSGWASETFGNPSGTGAMNVGAYNWNSSATYRTGSGLITINGAQTMGSHDLTIETDTTPVVNAAITSTGTLTIEPATVSTTIGFAGGAGSLAITQALMDSISAPNVAIGRSDGTGLLTTGAFTWESTLTNLTLQGGSIEVGGNITKSAGGNGTLTLTSVSDIVVDAAVAIASTSGKLNTILDADTAGNGGAIIMNTGSSIISNGGNIVLGGGSDPTTMPAVGDATAVATDAWSVNYNAGIVLLGATLNAGGGNMSLIGTGWSDPSAVNPMGIYLAGATIVQTTGNGTITLTGIDGNNSGNGWAAGIFLQDDGTTEPLVSSANGDITITATATNGNHEGFTDYNGLVQTAGSGNITITGTTPSWGGLDMETWLGQPIEVSTVDGNITLTGTAGNNVGNDSNGIYMYEAAVASTGAGNITVTGNAGSGGSNSNQNYGIWLDNGPPGSSISSASGNITLTGTTTTAGVAGIHATNNTIAIGDGSTTGNITLIADSLDLQGAPVTTTGNLTIKPYTSGTTVGVGAGAEPLVITDAMLDTFSFGSLTIGSSTTGDMDINSAYSFTTPAVFQTGSGHNITLDGTITNSAAGTAITLASGGNFINNVGSGAIDLTGGGRWLVYSTNPADDTISGLSNDFRRFSCTYGGACPTFPGSGNGFLYSYTPLLPVTPHAASATYGSAAPGTSYTISGYLGGDAGSDNITGAGSYTTPYVQGNGVGTYNLTGAAGSLASAMGYGFSGATLNNGLTITPAALTVTANDTSRAQGVANPSFTYTHSALVGSDTNSVFSGALASVADANSPASGTFPITQGTLSTGANYTITFNPGTLTIRAAAPATSIESSLVNAVVQQTAHLTDETENGWSSFQEDVLDLEVLTNNFGLVIEPAKAQDNVKLAGNKRFHKHSLAKNAGKNTHHLQARPLPGSSPPSQADQYEHKRDQITLTAVQNQ